MGTSAVRGHSLLNFQEEMARPKRFELLTPRFVVWGKTIGLIEDRSHNNWCLKLLHDLRHESVATLGSISYFDDARGKLVLGARPNFDRRRHKNAAVSKADRGDVLLCVPEVPAAFFSSR